jgi:uncharacterized protein (TIGR02145 family)
MTIKQVNTGDKTMRNEHSEHPANPKIGVIGVQTILAATLGFAITFTLSCSSGDDPNNGNGGGKGNDIANYKTVVIGTQEWMAENLNYAVSGSKCGGTVLQTREFCDDDEGCKTHTYYPLEDKNTVNCDKYGRLYDWATAMALPAKCNAVLSTSDADCTHRAPHKGICPAGWHIPSDAEWTTLTDFVGTNPGTKLKAKSGWSEGGNGTDEHGFSALQGGWGFIYSDFSVYDIGDNGDLGVWWNSTEAQSSPEDYDSYSHHPPYMAHNRTDVGRVNGEKAWLHSLRCVKD